MFATIRGSGDWRRRGGWLPDRRAGQSPPKPVPERNDNRAQENAALWGAVAQLGAECAFAMLRTRLELAGVEFAECARALSSR